MNILSFIKIMEWCASSLTNLFQMVDSISLLSQLLLEDLREEDIFQRRYKNGRFLIMIDNFCDITLNSLNNFLEHRSLKEYKTHIRMIRIDDIPCTLKQIHMDIPHIRQQFEETFCNHTSDNHDVVYFSRLNRFLYDIEKEIVFFILQDDMSLLHTCNKN